MKIQNLTIVFLAVIIPIIAIFSYYLHLQQETLQMQIEYDTKLKEATKEGIDAFEVNTIDWKYYNQKNVNITRTDVQNSINTFLASLGNKLNVSGTAKEYIQNYVPAIVFTGYDGYYIYSQNPKTTVTVTENDSVTIEDSSTEYENTLQNKTAYSERYNNFIINYTLDNKLYVYGKTTEDKYVEKFGRLIYITEESGNVLPRIGDNGIKQGIGTVNTQLNPTISIKPETLTEQILYKNENGEYTYDTFKYIYDINDEKKYYDSEQNNFFTLNDLEREYLNNNAGFGTSDCRYKSMSVLYGDGKTTEFKKVYQVLNGTQQGNWYIGLETNEKGDKLQKLSDNEIQNLGLNSYSIDIDFSDISYYVEGYAFTNWVNENLGNCENITIRDEEVKNPFKIGQNNNPDDVNSPFVQHKKEVIKNSIQDSLNEAISNYSRNTSEASDGAGYRIPVIKEADWDQALSNVSMITFFQGVPVGLKMYNNYAVATSTKNRAFVDPTEIFFSGEGTFHRAYCKECGNISYTGYRSVEFLQKSYNNNQYKYYQHINNTNEENKTVTACYYCAVNKGSYQKTTGNSDNYKRQDITYNEALARERYEQKEKLNPYGEIKVNSTKVAELPQMIVAIDMSSSMNNKTKITNNGEEKEAYKWAIDDMDTWLNGLTEGPTYDITFIFWDKTIIGEFTWKNKNSGTVNEFYDNNIAELKESGTYYLNALDTAYKKVNSKNSVIVFMSDGLPTDLYRNANTIYDQNNGSCIIQENAEGKYDIFHVNKDGISVEKNVDDITIIPFPNKRGKKNEYYSINGRRYDAYFIVDKDGNKPDVHQGSIPDADFFPYQNRSNNESQEIRKNLITQFLGGKFIISSPYKIYNLNRTGHLDNAKLYTVYYKTVKKDTDESNCKALLQDMVAYAGGMGKFYSSGLTQEGEGEGESLYTILNTIATENSSQGNVSLSGDGAIPVENLNFKLKIEWADTSWTIENVDLIITKDNGKSVVEIWKIAKYLIDGDLISDIFELDGGTITIEYN